MPKFWPWSWSKLLTTEHDTLTQTNMSKVWSPYPPPPLSRPDPGISNQRANYCCCQDLSAQVAALSGRGTGRGRGQACGRSDNRILSSWAALPLILLSRTGPRTNFTFSADVAVSILLYCVELVVELFS